jgi:glycosyltransferase involved in cell wall biosynthesis
MSQYPPSPKPTVLISINTSWNIYHFRGALVRHLQSTGYRVVSAAPTDAYTPRLKALVDEHIELPMANAGTSPLQDLVLWWRYLRVLRRVRPDVFLGYTIKPNIYGTLAAGVLGVPVINNVSGLGTVFIRETWLTKVAKNLYRCAFCFSHHVFFQNEEDQRAFVNMGLVAEGKTERLPGSGVDLVHFSPQQHTAMKDSADMCFILIARMLWDKGVGEFVEAAKIVKRQYPEARFCLLGPVGIENKTSITKETIDGWVNENIVEYLGETDDTRAYVLESDCVVLPSYREGLSRVLLEAAAMGKPIITTDVPGCRQVVDHGTNGLLCAAQDAGSLAEQLMTFIQMPMEERQRMGRSSREKAEREYDQKFVLQSYERAIGETLPH